MSDVYVTQAVRSGLVPLVVSPQAMRHGLRQAKRLFWIALQRRALDRVDCFRPTSEIEYQDIRRLGFQQPVALFPNGIDLPHLSQPEQTKDRTLLFLGRLHTIKGVDTLIEAWRTVQDDFPSWRLLIVGNGTNELGTGGYMAELRRFVSDQGTARVSFAGELIGAAKLDAYTNASVYVLPSHSENFGVTVAEALSVGTPVITTDRTPWRGLEARGAGWFIESGPAPLALCLREALATDEAVLRRMGLSGRRWMQTEFSWADIGRRMVATYRWVRGETAAQPPWVYAD